MTAHRISEIDCAYAAGILDGEGCITSTVSSNRGRPRCRPRVTIVNTDLPLLLWLQDRWGGTVAKRDKGVNKPVYTLDMRTGSLVGFLSDLRPYLRVKGTEADVALEMAATMGQGRNGRQGTPEHVHAARLALHDRLKSLKAA